jgi:DNA-binding NarL/FixJ family response regulator
MVQQRVLIVDDNAQVRRELHTMLALAGEIDVVGEAADGQEALRQVKALQLDVVVMDMEMPVMDGYEATRQIKAISPDCRVVALTVHATRRPGKKPARPVWIVSLSRVHL